MFDGKVAAHQAIRPAKQRLPVPAHAREIQHLLLFQNVAARHVLKRGPHAGPIAWIVCRRQHRFAQVLQAMPPGMLHKVDEAYRMVSILKFIVASDPRTALLHPAQLLFDQQAICIAFRSGLKQEANEREPA